MDDRQIADTVNALRDTGKAWAHSDQLRERLGHIIVPHLQRLQVAERALTRRANMQDEAASRADFEAFISAPPYEYEIERIPDDPEKFAWPGNYRDLWVHLAWQTWQEAIGRAENRLNLYAAIVRQLRQMLALQACIAHPEKSHAEIAAEIDRVLSEALSAPEGGAL